MNRLLFYIRNYRRRCVLCGSKDGRWHLAGIPAFGYKQGHICAPCLKPLYEEDNKERDEWRERSGFLDTVREEK